MAGQNHNLDVVYLRIQENDFLIPFRLHTRVGL
jgi:hypothetical protein